MGRDPLQLLHRNRIMGYTTAKCRECNKEFKVKRDSPEVVICPDCFAEANVSHETVRAGDSGKWGAVDPASPTAQERFAAPTFGSSGELQAEPISHGFDIYQSHNLIHQSHIDPTPIGVGNARVENVA